MPSCLLILRDEKQVPRFACLRRQARNDNCREQAPASFSGKRGRSIKKPGQREFIACRKRMRWGGSGCPTACALLVASALAAGVEIDELDERRFVELNSLLGGDFLQRVVDVRQMIGGDVAHEGAGDFVVAHAAVQPAQEDDELHRDRNKRCEPAHAGTPAGARNEHWNRLERPSRGIDGHSERRKLWTICYALFADGRVSSRCE